MATSTAVCTESTYDWLFNSLRQSPCQVAAHLGGVCNAGQFSVDSLEPDSHYLGPRVEAANECRCSSVFYSTIAACSACQGSLWLDWSDYNLNCSTVYTGTFVRPIPTLTRVPHWAYIDPTADDTFNITAAMQQLNAPESTALSQPTDGPGGSSSSSRTKGSSKAGPIAGGVVGGVVGLALIAGAVFWWFKRRRTKTAPSAEASHTPAPLTPMTATSPMGTAPVFSPVPPQNLKLYNPSDPSTYPSTISSPGISTSSTQALNPNATGSTYSGITSPALPQGARYTGVPEV